MIISGISSISRSPFVEEYEFPIFKNIEILSRCRVYRKRSHGLWEIRSSIAQHPERSLSTPAPSSIRAPLPTDGVMPVWGCEADVCNVYRKPPIVDQVVVGIVKVIGYRTDDSPLNAVRTGAQVELARGDEGFPLPSGANHITRLGP